MLWKSSHITQNVMILGGWWYTCITFILCPGKVVQLGKYFFLNFWSVAIKCYIHKAYFQFMIAKTNNLMLNLLKCSATHIMHTYLGLIQQNVKLTSTSRKLAIYPPEECEQLPQIAVPLSFICHKQGANYFLKNVCVIVGDNTGFKAYFCQYHIL